MEEVTGTNYYYKKEQDEYVLYNGEEKVCNPDNEVISTENEDLAKRLVKALKDGEDYTSGKSILCYHYTFCNLRQHTIEEFVNEFSSYMTYDAFLWDHYLMFKQCAPVKQAFAPYFSSEYAELLRTFNKYQFIAILVVHKVYNSWMLSYRIIADIINQLNDVNDASSYNELKEDFMYELEEFERAEYADNVDWDDKDDNEEEEDDDDEDDEFEKAYGNYSSEMSQIIDVFTYYFTLK